MGPSDRRLASRVTNQSNYPAFRAQFSAALDVLSRELAERGGVICSRALSSTHLQALPWQSGVGTQPKGERHGSSRPAQSLRHDP